MLSVPIVWSRVAEHWEVKLGFVANVFRRWVVTLPKCILAIFLFLSLPVSASTPSFDGYFRGSALGMEIVLDFKVNGQTVSGTYRVPALEKEPYLQKPYTVKGEVNDGILNGELHDPVTAGIQYFRAELVDADTLVFTELRKRLVRKGYTEKKRQFQRSQRPAPPPVAKNSGPGSSEWDTRLRGARLTFLTSYHSGGSGGQYVGGSETHKIDLCAEGHFYSRGSSVVGGSSSGGGVVGSSGGSSNGQGQWSVVSVSGNNVLRLQSNSGGATDYTLQFADGKTTLNGERYFRTFAGDTDPDHRPTCP